ncbi:MAG: hypothetical protein Q8N28_02940 [bacterium]|nr:hypothetical protein [bacterium]
MIKKTLIFIIILFALLGLYFIYNYFIQPSSEAPIEINNGQIQEIPISDGFRGPSGSPSIKGPSGPPPEN